MTPLEIADAMISGFEPVFMALTPVIVAGVMFRIIWAILRGLIHGKPDEPDEIPELQSEQDVGDFFTPEMRSLVDQRFTKISNAEGEDEFAEYGYNSIRNHQQYEQAEYEIAMESIDGAYYEGSSYAIMQEFGLDGEWDGDEYNSLFKRQ